MQLSDIRDEVRRRVGLSSTDTMAADADMTKLINAAYRQISLEKDWDWLTANETISVTAGDDEYAVAADWRTTLYVGRQIDASYPDGSVPLIRSQRRDIREQSIREGVPEYWMIESGVLRVAPVPAQAETLLHTYVKQITALSADGDAPFIPDDYVDYLIVRAAKLLATRLGDRDMAALLRSEEAELSESIADETYRARGSVVPRTRQDTSWGG